MTQTDDDKKPRYQKSFIFLKYALINAISLELLNISYPTQVIKLYPLLYGRMVSFQLASNIRIVACSCNSALD